MSGTKKKHRVKQQRQERRRATKMKRWELPANSINHAEQFEI